MALIENTRGQYRFLTGVAPFSSGVMAMAGNEIVHVALHRPLPYREGFQLIDRHLKAQGRPRQALCGIELRSPKPFTFEGFAEFNQGYQDILADWDIWVDGKNPVARTNVAPEVGAPGEPVLYGFSHTVPSESSDTLPTFVMAGAAELKDGALSPEAIVRAGETSPEAFREKVAFVVAIMQQRMNAFQLKWSHATEVEIYTVHPLQPLVGPEILEKIGPAAMRGLHWFYSRPPVLGLEFEMDLRGVRQEIRLHA
jgi:hypothetical protein